ncbi:MAG: DegT/DnrJ/EryC1/StrS family aminotransferase [Atopobiaceae bacterium]|nr:DegT/DnrJ/EryC1/StrS family aminotransferase [Atopobiaceae bacterium]
MTSSSRVFVTSPALPPFEEFVDEIRDIWDTYCLTHQGPKYHALEEQISQYLQVDSAPLFANGHLALQVAFWSLGLTEGEVITTPFTFASTTQAIVGCGLTPVFCDIDPVTWCIDAAKIEALITPRTKAIVGVHVYGVPCDFEEIDRIAKEHDLIVIYDAAHAFGETYGGRGIGTFGDMSMFSMHATKVFNTVEGGCLTFNKDDELYQRVCSIRQFGAYLTDETKYVGTNAKLTEMHAAMGLCNLRHIDEYIAQRKTAYEVYEQLFAGVEGMQRLRYPDKLKPNYSYYPVVIDSESFGCSRDELAVHLEEHGIFARKYFYPLTSTFECYQGVFPIQATPVARKIAQRVLCLPLYADLDASMVEYIAGLVLESRDG